MDYADKLTKLIPEVEDKLLVVMRAYFESHATVGWKDWSTIRPGRKSQDRERDQAC